MSTNTFNNVASIKVSPGIGIGRVGNSDDYFIGPEVPGVVPNPGNGQYKDSSGAIKPQAQRFRVFGYDASGELLGEITHGSTINGSVVSIDWQVHVTNMKAANYAFQGKYAFNPNDLRNSTIQPDLPPAQRDKLIIDPGQKTISGVSQGPVELLDAEGSKIFDIAGTTTLSSRLQYDPPQTSTSGVAVSYTPATVSLGNLYTDGDGRLIFVGGKGVSESCTTPKVVISKVVVSQTDEPNPEYNGNSYFNNPGWYDDTCGGSINAAIKDASGNTLFSTSDNASQTGWIAVAPPHYAPASNNVVSLLDLQLDVFPASDPYTGQGPFYFAQTDSDNISLAVSTTGDASDLSFTTLLADFTTFVAPAIATFQGKTYIAVTASSSDSYIASSDNNSFSFTQITNAPSTSAAPALAVLNNFLYYAINNNGTLNIGTTDGNGSFAFSALSTSQTIDAAQAPSLAALNGSLYYATASSTGTLLLASSKNDVAASNFDFAELTTASPLAANSNIGMSYFVGKLYIGFIGTDEKLYLGSSADGQTFTFSAIGSIASGSTGLGVSLSSFNNQLYYAVSSSTTSAITTQLGVSNNGRTFTFSNVNSNGTSSPAIATNIPVNFYRDIYPILKTVTDYAWTNERAFHGHRPGTSGDFLNPDYLYTLSQPDYSSQLISRPFVFSFIRPPAQEVFVQGSTDPIEVPPPPAAAPANITAGTQQQRADLMPRLFGNGGSTEENNTNGTNYPNQWLPLTNHQLEKFQQWVNGNFEPGSSSDTQWQGLDQPSELDFAALQPTVGGGFHPGIELTYLMHESTFFDSAFRFAQNTQPGSIAAYMSVPWQGDFWSCNISWWPALRPDIVVERTDDTPPVLSHIPWFRGNEIPPESDSISGYEGGYNIMVDNWKNFGFVTPVTGMIDQGQQVFAEVERNTALDQPSQMISIASSQISNGKALNYDGSNLTIQPTENAVTSQLWALIASASSSGFFFIQHTATEQVLTVDFATGNISLAAQKVPQEDSQLWQYQPSGYPGHFNLISKINLQLLSAASDDSVSTQTASSSLQQLWLLQSSVSLGVTD